MGSYLPHTPQERARMLKALGLDSLEGLFGQIPPQVMLPHGVALPPGVSEMEALEEMRALAQQNTRYALTLRGAGCYDHYIPPLVSRMAAKEEFVTAYTPYQAELSQGVLQTIFEFQTHVCALTGMDASNASVYDGATAAAEAAVMCRDRKRRVALVSAAVHPDVRSVVSTYAFGSGDETRVVPLKDGVTDAAALEACLRDDTACFLVQQPNFYGCLEDVEALFALCRSRGVKCVLVQNPMTFAMLKSGAEVGADIVCGDAQPFGLPMSFGGPSLGYMACVDALKRRLPGRIVGQTTDAQGRRAFVLTLQAREQHIRREKASSNICSNQAHCALTASIYLNYMGPEGLGDAARACYAKAHFLAERLCEIPGVKLKYGGPFFHEFVTVLPGPAQAVERALAKEGVLSGLPLGQNEMLWCVTEKAGAARLNSVAGVTRLALADGKGASL